MTPPSPSQLNTHKCQSCLQLTNITMLHCTSSQAKNHFTSMVYFFKFKISLPFLCIKNLRPLQDSFVHLRLFLVLIARMSTRLWTWRSIFSSTPRPFGFQANSRRKSYSMFLVVVIQFHINLIPKRAWCPFHWGRACWRYLGPTRPHGLVESWFPLDATSSQDHLAFL